jgi:hypothetical protein
MSNRKRINLVKLARVMARPFADKPAPGTERPCCESRHGHAHLPDCPFATDPEAVK